MNAQRIFTKTFVLGALSLFVLVLGPGQAQGVNPKQGFNPQPEPPGEELGELGGQSLGK